MGFLLLYMANDSVSLWQVNSVLHEDKAFQLRHKEAGVYSGTGFF